MSLLTVKFVKKSLIWARIHFIFLKNVEMLLIPISILVKRSETQLSSKTNVCKFLQFSSATFRLKECDRP